MINDPSPSDVEGWFCLLKRNKEYEVQMIQSFLEDREIPSNILSKHDSAYNVNVGDMAPVYLYVPNDYKDLAKEAMKAWEKAGENSNEGNEDL